MTAATTADSTTTPTLATDEHADPGEVDISEHFYEPQATKRIPVPQASAGAAEGPAISEAQLRQMMLGMDRPGESGTPPVGVAGAGQVPGDDDPIMKMMSQMMAAGGQPGGGAAGAAGASPFAGMMPPQTGPRPPDTYGTLWRVVHALIALGLGFYIVVLTPFSGTLLQREDMAYETRKGQWSEEHAQLEQHKRNFFWAFATAETLLLTTRFFLDKGRSPPPGFLWTIVSHVPEPWKGYISSVMRYGQIFTTVRTDILVCMFVLGASSLWRG